MRLDIARKIQRKTQLALGAEVNIHASKISLIENGFVEASDKEKDSLAKALGFRVDEIDW